MKPPKKLRGRALAAAQTIKALEGKSDEEKFTIDHYGIPLLDKILKGLKHREDLKEVASLIEDRKKALEEADSKRGRMNIHEKFHQEETKKWKEHPWTTRMKNPSWMNASVEIERAMKEVTNRELDKAEAKRFRRNLEKFKRDNLPKEEKDELIKIFKELGNIIAEKIERDLKKQQEITEAITLDAETAFTTLGGE